MKNNSLLILKDSFAGNSFIERQRVIKIVPVEIYSIHMQIYQRF